MGIRDIHQNQLPTEVWTPQAAQAALDHADALGFKNRPVNEAWADEIARRMDAGLWRVTHQGIAFDVNGVCFDGRHRLLGVVRCGKPIRITTFRGCDPSTFAEIDIGGRRDVRDLLSMSHGLNRKESTVLGAAARLYTLWARGDEWAAAQRTRPASEREVLNTVNENPGLHDSVLACDHPMTRNGAWVFLHYVASQSAASEFSDFLKRVQYGEGITTGEPAWQYRERVMSESRSRSKSKPEIMRALMVKSWNMHLAGATRKLLRWKPEAEPFPAIAMTHEQARSLMGCGE